MLSVEKALGKVKLKIRNSHRQFVSGKGMDVVYRGIDLTVVCMMDGNEEILESRRVGKMVSAVIISRRYYNYQCTKIWLKSGKSNGKKAENFKDVMKHKFTEFKDRTWQSKESE